MIAAETQQKPFKLIKMGFILLLALMIIISYFPSAVFSSSPGTIYYVANTGDDAGPGTLEAPWRTIQKAADTLIGGDTVLVRGGLYEEFVSITSSGSEPAGYITFQAYPGEKPVIDGSNLVIPSGNNALIHLRGANYIVVEGFELRNLSTSSSSEYPAGMRVEKGGSNIHLLNNNVHHIQNLAPDGNAHGIHIYGNSLMPLTNIKVSGNEVHQLILGSSESLTVNGNVDGFSIENNIVHDNNNIGIDIAGFYGACSAPCLDQARNGIVSGNIVFNIDSSVNPAYGSGSNSAGGIYADGSANVLIERNHVYNNDFGIEIASENQGAATSDITVQSNYIHHNDGAGIIMGGSQITNGGAANNFIVNNTLVENDRLQQGYGEITLQENTVNNSIMNNIIYSLPGKLMVSKYNSSGSSNRIDFNLYYRTDGGNEGSWKWEGQSYTTWDEYKAATGFDANSIFGDPKMTNVYSGDITLQSTSLAIDRGSDSYGNYDFFGVQRKQGAAIDIGASEYAGLPIPSVPASPEPTPVPTDVPIVTPVPQEPTPLPTGAPNGTPVPIPTPEQPLPSMTPPSGKFVIDGNSNDWDQIGEIATGSSNVRAIKAVTTKGELHVLVTGNLLGEKGQLYMNTDGNSKSGFQAGYWDEAGADYLLENGILYSYSGKGGTNWGWKKVRSYTKENKFFATSTVVEASLSLADLGGLQSGAAIQLGYLWKDSHENKLPVGKQFIEAQTGNFPYPEPSEEPAITIDGDHKDWGHVASLSTGAGNPKVLRVTSNDENLYILIEGSKLASKTQVYVNTDQNSQSGYRTSKWESSGAEFLIENGRLYSYSGKGSNWSWKSVSNLSKTNAYVGGDSIIEMVISLSTLGLSVGEEVQLGVMLDDDKLKQLPISGGLTSYTIND